MSKIIPFSNVHRRIDISNREVEIAIAEGSQAYFNACRSKVPAFVDQHFCYPGAVATNKVAWGWDILLAPVNLLWAPFYALLCVFRFILPRSTKAHCLLRRAPAGFTTHVQRHILDLVKLDLLNKHVFEQRFTDFAARSVR